MRRFAIRRLGMRAVGLAVLVCALAFGGDAFAGFKHNQWPQSKACIQGGVSYKQSDYCYTSCAPTAACELEVCMSTGEWMEVGPCKVRDCRKVC
jgi:hypothetical protein